MSRLLARLFGWGSPAAAEGADALGEILRCPGEADIAPEILLRIL
ncbi:hypothetical protein [Erythrobacter sp.]|nr:hypothetical protein [Erythrobacter sp.]